jgi:hypothetical protein
MRREGRRRQTGIAAAHRDLGITLVPCSPLDRPTSLAYV